MMFFIGILGIDKKEEKIRDLDHLECRECGISGRCFLSVSYSRFTFFFIPLFSWGWNYFIRCENCGTVYSVKEDKKEYSYFDLSDVVYRREGNGPGSAEKRCPGCGCRIEEEYNFCPHCGYMFKK